MSSQSQVRDSSSGGVALDQSPAAAPAPRRRRPRKLNRLPNNANTTVIGASNNGARFKNADNSVEAQGESTLDNEIKALKSRVRGLESQMSALQITSNSSREDDMPTNKKDEIAGVNTNSTGRRQGSRAARRGAARTELAGLENELKETRAQLASLRQAEREELDGAETQVSSSEVVPLTANNTGIDADGDDDIEVYEIDNSDAEDIAKLNYRPSKLKSRGDIAPEGNRLTTLSGSYRIALPAGVSVDDVRAIQQGVRSASGVARSLFDAASAARQGQSDSKSNAATPRSSPRRAQSSSATRSPQSIQNSPASLARAASTSRSLVASNRSATGANNDLDNSKSQNWGSWLGEYSVAVSRLVSKSVVEAQAAIEQDNGQSRPVQNSTPRHQVSRRAAVRATSK